MWCENDASDEDMERSCKYWLCCIHVKYFVPVYAFLNLLLAVMFIVMTVSHRIDAEFVNDPISSDFSFAFAYTFTFFLITKVLKSIYLLIQLYCRDRTWPAQCIAWSAP